ncbi:MAG: hypothetical protein KTV68_17740 [Acidimicrobiia bacterium]|nr:hypothetical protein [Acidimicrobiia bacterium]
MTAPVQDGENGFLVSLKATFASWRLKKNNEGQEFGQEHKGDVFEQAEEMIEAGRRAVDSMLAQMTSDQDKNWYEERWPDKRGWRDGCYADLELRIVDGIDCSMYQPPKEAQVCGDEGRPDGLNPSERYLMSVLKRVMVGNEVVRHPEEGKGSTHDFDLLTADGLPVVRVECVELTNQAAKSWSRGGRDGGCRDAKLSAKQKFNYQWEARITARNLSEEPWQTIHRQKTSRKKQLRVIEEKLAEIAVWAETQMGTPNGAANVANERVRRESGVFPETVRPHLIAKEVGGGQKGGLITAYDGSSSGWFGGPGGTCEPTDASLINETIAEKAEENQAGAHPEPKWLLISIDQIWVPNVVFDLQACLADPTLLSSLADNIDLKCFDEVWLVWEAIEQHEPSVQATSVVIFSRGGIRPRHLVAAEERM